MSCRAAIFAVTAITGSEPVPLILILAAGIMMLILDARPSLHRPWQRKPRRPPKNGGSMTLQSWSPALLLPALLGPIVAGGTLLALGLFFLQTGALVFGSGLAIVPLLRDGVVAQHQWLTQASSWTPSPWD